MSTHSQSASSILLALKGRSVGLKISRLKDGSGIITAREVGGKKLFIAPLTPSSKSSQSAQTIIDLQDGKKATLTAKVEGNRLTMNSDLRDLSIVNNPTGTQSPEPSAQGWLWDFFTNLVSDVVAAVGAATTWMVGGRGSFKLSGGGAIYVEGEDGVISYLPGSGGWKAEEGLEEDPNIWY